ncbi:hypothetical protein BH10ACT8_BH10ACT8_30560 [soil metagenome]
MIAVQYFRPSEDLESFQQHGAEALAALAARPGFLGGSLGRATDDDTAWLLLTEGDSVGSYRRALGGYEVKMVATPLMAQALDLPGAFEQLVSIDADGSRTVRTSDRAPDADWVSRLGPA